MRKKKFMVGLALMIVASVVFISCDLVSISDEDIVGTWKDGADVDEWIISVDNSFINNSPYGTNTGTWSLETKDLLSLDYDGDRETDVYEVSVSNGSMSWASPDSGITWHVYFKVE